MKPILLQGHERSITQVKYNREGDLIFSCSKDNTPNVWYSLNGERLGSYNGHNGAIWAMDVNWDSTKVLTASADNTCKLWDCETGKNLVSIETNTGVRTCSFSFSGKILALSTDKTMGFPCEIQFFDLGDPNQLRNSKPFLSIPINSSKVTTSLWGPFEEYMVTGHENGELCQYDTKTGELVHQVKEHNKQINDIQSSKDLTMIVTASKDNTAKLFDTSSLDHLKTYRTERPVNSAAISPLRDHIVLGGGQEAMEVTTTSTRVGKFDARFFSLVFEEEFARVKGHFGPINSVMFHPDGRSYASGAEDGFIRVHYFDPSYFEHTFEV